MILKRDTPLAMRRRSDKRIMHSRFPNGGESARRTHFRYFTAVTVASILAAVSFPADSGDAAAAVHRSVGRIAFAANGQLWLTNTTTSSVFGHQGFTGAETITSGFVDQDPAFSRDGRLLAFDRVLHSVVTVMVAAAPAGPPKAITPGVAPAFSPNGRQLVFSRDTGLWVTDPTGHNVRRLTTVAADRDPSWGSNGLIAFERRTRHGTWIYGVGPDGHHLTRLVWSTRPHVALRWPQWSPDGESLALSVCGFALGSLRWNHSLAIVPVSRCAGSAAWSPDGSSIAVDGGGLAPAPTASTAPGFRAARRQQDVSFCALDPRGRISWAALPRHRRVSQSATHCEFSYPQGYGTPYYVVCGHVRRGRRRVWVCARIDL